MKRVKYTIVLPGLVSVLHLLMANQAFGRDDNTLLLTPANTVILDGSRRAGPYLQYYLLRCVAEDERAERYAPDVKPRPARHEAGAFPLFQRRQFDSIPDDRIVIALGSTRYLEKADRERLAANPGAILLKRRGNVIVIAANSEDPWGAPLRAVSVFLDRCAGVRIYAPHRLWWSGPEKPHFEIGQLDVFKTPVLDRADWSGSWLDAYPHQWARINATHSGGHKLRASHTLARFFDPDKYYEKHPELYEMRNGRRPKPSGQEWNPSLAQPELLARIAMEEIRAIMEKQPNRRYVSLGIMDAPFDDETPEIQKIVQEHDGSYSVPYYRFINLLARQVAKEYPDLLLTTYAYANVRQAPPSIRIEPNVVVTIVTKSYRWVSPVWAQQEKALLQAWSDTGAKWMVHDWSFSGVSPREYTRQFALFYQWAEKNGVFGSYTEWSVGEAWYLDGPKYWIMRQLLSDPHQDVDALWKQYCDDMYGPASETMYRFFQHFADKYTFARNYIHLRDLPREEVAMYTQADLEYQQQLLERAQQQTRNHPRVQQRLTKLKRYWKGHALFARAVGEPARSAYRFDGDGINREALAFYVNDDGSVLREAIRFYEEERTQPPDARVIADRLGLLDSYVANYSRALVDIIQSIRSRAKDKIDLTQASPEAVQRLHKRMKDILTANLPESREPSQVKRIEGLLNKVVWLPAIGTTPVIDGKIDDAVWTEATRLEDFSLRNILLPSLYHPTRGRIARVGSRLVVALECQQRGPVWSKTTPDIESGTAIWRESGVEIFFGPSTSTDGTTNPPFAQYIVNARGAFAAFGVAKGQRENVEVAVRELPEAQGYVIEAAFPLKTRNYDFTSNSALSFNIMRNVYRKDSYQADEIIGWAPIVKSARMAESRGLLLTKPE